MGETLRTGMITDLFEKGKEIIHDGWVNVALGFGTSRDKTAGGMFNRPERLQDQELAALYAHDDIAAKIVNVYPREAMREGFELAGLDDADKLKEASDFIDKYNCRGL